MHEHEHHRASDHKPCCLIASKWSRWYLENVRGEFKWRVGYHRANLEVELPPLDLMQSLHMLELRLVDAQKRMRALCIREVPYYEPMTDVELFDEQ